MERVDFLEDTYRFIHKFDASNIVSPEQLEDAIQCHEMTMQDQMSGLQKQLNETYG